MKPLLWDAINPFTGQPWTWDDPNARWDFYLEPGDPGFVPYPGMKPTAPPQKKRPFRHAPKPQTTTTPEPNLNPTTMSTFKYNVVPKTGGGFTTRPVLGPEFEDATIDNAVAAATGLTAAQCASVFTGYLQQFLACAAGCSWSHAFHDWVSIRPTSGGSSADPDGFHTAGDLNASVSLAINPARLDTWRSGLSIESQGQTGMLAPEIDSIINLHDGSQDSYTTGEIIQLSGDHLAFDKADTTQGVFYATAAAPGTKVRIGSYGPITPTQINAIVPSGLTGALTISVTVKISGTLRTSTYMHPVG
jgi:hypothetical protein